MTRPSSIFVAVLALTACASPPGAATPASLSAGPTRTLQELAGSRIATPVGLFLTSLDIDRDANVSRTEILDGVAESFNASDANDDGFLRPIEFEDWSRTYLGSEYTLPGRLHFDPDQDGRVSLSEFTATFDEIHQRLDSDRDGGLARAELLSEVGGVGIDQTAIRAQIEADIRRNMQGRMREMCQRGGRRP